MPPTPTPMPPHGASSRAVDAAGYGASLPSAESESAELEDTETPKLKKRLVASLSSLVPLMYVSMGHMIGLPLGSVFHGGGWHAILYAGTQLVLTLPVCWINRAFFLSRAGRASRPARPAWIPSLPSAPARRWPTACSPSS